MMASIGYPLTESGTLEGMNPRAQMRGHRVEPEGAVAYALRDEPKGKGQAPTEGSEERFRDPDFTSKKGRFDTVVQDRSLAPFNVRGFRNNQLFGNRRLPSPTVTARGLDPFGSGMLSLQRNIRAPSGARRMATIGATNVLPLLNPRVQIDRKKQVAAMGGDKNEHLWSAGDLDQDRMLNLLSGDEELDLGMEGVSVARGPFGDAMIMDDKTGLPLPHIAYSVFDLKDPTKKEGRWRDDNRRFRPVDAGQDWRETITGPKNKKGEVTGSIDPVLRIPIALEGGGVGIPRFTDDSDYRFEGIPVPMNLAPHEGELGLERGISTGSKGIFFRPEDLTDAGRDVFDTAMRGDVIRLSGDSFEDAWELLKAYGDPDEMGWWSKTYGGQSPGKNDRAVFDWIRQNKDKLNEYLADRRVEWDVDNPVEIPRFESELPRGKQRRDEMFRILGASSGSTPFSFTRKMPGPSLAFPVHTCNVGMRMAGVKDSTCAGCYATQGRYPLNTKQIQAYNNLHALTENDPRYASALVDRMKAEMAYYGEPYFRFFDSGDLQRGRGETPRNMGAQHFAQLIDVARATPEGKFWLPTREVAGVQDVMRRRGEDAIPDNMKVRLSLNFPGQSSDDEINEAFGLPNVLSSVKRLNEMPNIEVSGVSSLDPAMKTCPASALGGSCDDYNCRDCWDFQGPISYNAHMHGSKNKVIPLRSSKGIGLDYDELLRPMPVSTNPDVDIRQFLRKQ